MILINYLALLINLYVIFMQGVNFFKYRKDGANKKRVILFLSTIFLLVHLIKRIHVEPMPFLCLASLGAMILYDGFDFKKWFIDIWNK